MRTRTVQMTPAAAEKLLRKNTKNRPVIKGRVDVLVAAIEAGQWKLTHQGVAIGPDGEIVDGQHRLTAISRAGVTVPLLVTNLDEDVFDVIDSGRPRGASDTLRLQGVTNAAMFPPVARLLTHYRSESADLSMGSWHAKLTNTDHLIALEKWPEMLKWARRAEHTADLIGRRGLRTPILAAMTVIDQDVDGLDDTKSEFFSKLGEPVMLGADSPVIALRRWLVISLPAVQNARAQTGFYGILKAWNAYAAGEAYTKVSIRVGREPAPIVGNPAPAADELEPEELDIAQ